MKNIQAVIFDMDGLMFDTESLSFRVFESIFDKRGKIFSSDVHNKMMGRKSGDVVKIILDELQSNEKPEAIEKEKNDAYLELLKSESKPMPGLFELLDSLEKHNTRKAIASGSRLSWIRLLMDKFNIADRFEVIVSGDDVMVAKPNPEIYLLTVKKLGLDPKNCIVLDDALNGVKAAKAAGCVTIAVPSGYTHEQDFSEADYIVKSLSDTKILDVL